jgi:8-amino-3,8-dideoxy-alpha-D-manno-octulosonate transaminase
VFGIEEQQAVEELFRLNGGVLFAHGFDALRKGVYRVREFEAAFGKKMNVPYAQAVTSGTAALTVALKAMGVKPGDEVIIPSFTFVATIEAVIECRAVPVIVDIDESLNICPKSVREAVTKKTKALLPVHMMGAPADMDSIMRIAKDKGLLVLEDTAQGCGGTYKGKYLGTIGDTGSFSFDAGKVMITGEGGMVVTSKEDFYIRARSVHDHGHEYSKVKSRGVEGALCTGYNFRMTEIQAAIGLAQLAKLDMIIKSQRDNKKKLKDLLKPLSLKYRTINDPGELGDALIFFLDSKEQAGLFAKMMSENGLGTKNLPDAIRWHFAGYWEHIYKEYGFYQDTWQTAWKKSADLLERAIALPVMVKMSDERITEIAEKVTKIAKKVL